MALVEYYGARAVFTNCIVWGNGSAFATNTDGVVDISYSDIQKVWPGVANIFSDPQFLAPAALNFQLSPSSPCIDTGIFAGVTNDCIGEVRPYGAAVDMGAYEFVPEPVAAGTTTAVCCLLFGRRRNAIHAHHAASATPAPETP